MNRLLIASVLFTLLGLTSGQLPVQSAAPGAASTKKPVNTKKKVTPPKPGPAKPTVINKSTIEDAGISYELTACKRQDELLVCRLFLTNKGTQDVEVSLKTSGTRFIDITGEEYLAKEVQIGSNKSETAAESILISQVPIKAIVTFDAPAANVVTIKVLALNHEPGSTLKFREFKIAK